MTEAVRKALYAKVAGSTSVTSLLASPTSIFYQQAPSSAGHPLVVLNKQAGTPTYAFGAVAYDAQVWQVKAISEGSSVGPAETVAAALDALLNLGSLTIEGGLLLDLRRQSDVDFSEVDGGQTYHHAGALFRVTAS